MMTDRNQGSGQRGDTVRELSDDPQIDEETGRPVVIVPDGEKQNRPEEIDGQEGLKIDPNSRIPRPVQPDVA
jgi:hypothetical protein